MINSSVHTCTMIRKRKETIVVGYTPSLVNSWQPSYRVDTLLPEAECLKQELIARENWKWNLQCNKSEVQEFGDPKHCMVFGIDTNNLVRV